jgi:hypothetical protein
MRKCLESVCTPFYKMFVKIVSERKVLSRSSGVFIFFFQPFLSVVENVHSTTTVLKHIIVDAFVEGFTGNIGVKINCCNLMNICNFEAVIAATSLIRDCKSLESTAFSWAIFSILTEFSNSRLSRPMTSSFSSRISFLLKNNNGNKTNR